MSIQNVTTYSQLVARLVGDLRQQQQLYDQKTFASLMGVSPSTWSRVESGQVGLSLDQLARAAQLFKRGPADILVLADSAAAVLAKKGVKVLAGKEAAKDDENFAYLGAAALGALVALVVAKSK